jgi:hypothetical protein
MEAQYQEEEEWDYQEEEWDYQQEEEWDYQQEEEWDYQQDEWTDDTTWDFFTIPEAVEGILEYISYLVRYHDPRIWATQDICGNPNSGAYCGVVERRFAREVGHIVQRRLERRGFIGVYVGFVPDERDEYEEEREWITVLLGGWIGPRVR